MPNSLLSTPARRWATGATVATVVVGAAVAGPLIAGADSDLPDRTAAELLVGLATIDVQPFAGTVVQSADVGLPDLDADTTSLPTAAMSLLNGSTTARIWYTDGDTYRFALQDDQSESDLLRNGEDLWFWSSEGATASHLVVPEETGDEGDGGSGPFGGGGPFGGDGEGGGPFGGEGMPEDLPSNLPTAAAGLALAMIEPSTQVDVDGTATVAGRSAYELVLRPKDEQSLIGSIRLAIDGENNMPLRVQIFARDHDEPSFEVGFTSVSFDEPDESTYEFTPPPGTTVEEIQPDELDDAVSKHERPDFGADGHLDADMAEPTVVGSGWSSVVVAHGVDIDEMIAGLEGDAATMANAFVAELQDVSGPYGTGRAMTSDLFTVLLLDDGRVLAGAVPLEVLEQAAADPAAQ